MATKNRSIRCDDDVWEAIQKLPAKFVTVNLGLRVKLGLGEKAKAPAVKGEKAREDEYEIGDA